MHAVSALRPSCGAAAACAGCPAKTKLIQTQGQRRVREHVAIERVEHHRRVDALEGAGLDAGAIFPPPPSSAGVPTRTTSPPASFATEAAATNAPTAPAAMRL